MVSPIGSGADRRRSPRHLVQDVKGTLHLCSDARILNMSLTGMAVEVGSALKVGRVYSLTLRHGDDQQIRLTGSVVWCHLRGLRRNDAGESRTVYEAGIRFEDALSEHAAQLSSMLGATAVVTVEKRISGRFKVNVPEPVSVRSHHQFMVRTISTVGLLIETEETPPVGAPVEVEVDLHGAALRCRGRVAYLREVGGNSGSQQTQLGIEFVDPSAAERRTVEEFIRGQLQVPSGPDA